MPARLIPLTAGLSPPITLERPVVLIGRHADCDAQINLPQISRRHCCIAQVTDELVIRDLGSRTGVRINGYRVAESALYPGDEVAIGPLLFRLDIPPAPASQARRVAEESPSLPDDESDLVPLDD